MKPATRLNRSLRRMVLLSTLGALVACSGLTINSSRAVSWFTLNDVAQETEGATNDAPIKAVLIIGQVDANPFYDTTQLAFSRSDIARAYYQYAAWTERPTKRLATLIERRLAKRQGFIAVANSTAGIRGDLVLNLSLDEIYHDTIAQPASAKLVLHATLIESSTRSLIARKRFAHSAGVSDPEAASAVKALNQATSSLIDELSEWVEQRSRSVAKKSKTKSKQKGVAKK